MNKRQQVYMNDSNVAAPAGGKFDLVTSPSRSLVLALFGRLVYGSLQVLEDGTETWFGQPRHLSDLHATVIVRDARAWQFMLESGSLGAGEAYMLGYWESPDLLQVVRVFCRNMDLLGTIDGKAAWLKRLTARLFHLANRNSLKGARRNIAAHYDLSNDLFALFLDPTMAYSAALFASPDQDLEAASRNKFRHVCERLQLSADDHLLEIGTGWGGLAIHAARHYGARVTTTTLSGEQARFAREWISREGLSDRITVLEQDYRELTGTYDKLVSIEMIEAVGAEHYAEYFRRCSGLLKHDGLMLIQAITISDQRYEASLRNTDFIKRYIFPGGQLPCNAVLAGHVANDTDMQLVGLDDLTHDYALTLRHWRHNFHQALHDVRRLGFDETFVRMWRYYLCFCEGGFLERVIHTAQYLLAKPGFRNMPTGR